MITFDEFRELFQAIPGEPEFEIMFRDLKESYMIIKYSDHVSFQRCGMDTGSGEFDYQTLEELYNTYSIDGICLKERWDSIDLLEVNASFNLSCQQDIAELRAIYKIEQG